MSIGAQPEILDSVPGYVTVTGIGPYRLKDYLELPDEPRVELIEGRYYVSPAPIILHQTVSITLSSWLFNVAKESGGQALAAPCDLVLADHTVVQPDLLYFTRARRQPLAARFTSPPDLAIEILSTNHTRDRVKKAALYAEHGVAEYWIVDPAARSFDFFVLDSGKYVLQPQLSPIYNSPQSSELTIDLADFWKEIDRQIVVDDSGC